MHACLCCPYKVYVCAFAVAVSICFLLKVRTPYNGTKHMQTGRIQAQRKTIDSPSDLKMVVRSVV